MIKEIVTAALLTASLSSHAFELHSTDIEEGSRIANTFVFNSWGCSGKNQSPALSWSKGPEGTKSYAITVFDPDAPTESGFWHWQVINIPASVTSLKTGASGSIKDAIEMRNDYGNNAYGGPCPPKGSMHRYQFTVWALPVDKLGVPANASAAVVGFTLNQSALAKARITATYVAK